MNFLWKTVHLQLRGDGVLDACLCSRCTEGGKDVVTMPFLGDMLPSRLRCLRCHSIVTKEMLCLLSGYVDSVCGNRRQLAKAN